MRKTIALCFLMPVAATLFPLCFVAGLLPCSLMFAAELIDDWRCGKRRRL